MKRIINTQTQKDMETEERKDLLNRIYYKLLGDRIIANKSEFADAIKTSRPNVSNAMRGDKRYLTDTIFERIKERFGNVLDEDAIIPNVVDITTTKKPPHRYEVASGKLLKIIGCCDSHRSCVENCNL